MFLPESDTFHTLGSITRYSPANNCYNPFTEIFKHVTRFCTRSVHEYWKHYVKDEKEKDERWRNKVFAALDLVPVFVKTSSPDVQKLNFKHDIKISESNYNPVKYLQLIYSYVKPLDLDCINSECVLVRECRCLLSLFYKMITISTQ